MPTTLTAGHLLTPSGILGHPVITIEDGLIVEIGTDPGIKSDLTLTPALFDIHIHGAANHDVMEATSEALSAVGRFLASRGTGHYLPTTVTAPVDATLRALEGLAERIEAPTSEDEAQPVGIHLEGPFLSHAKRGVHPPDLLQPPSIPLFDRFYEAARGHIRLLTIAPEEPGALDLIRHATAKGVRVSLGHSNATLADAEAAIAAGANSATHTFNAMRALDHREPGLLGAVLDRQELFAEIICDGIHVAPELVRLWLRMKGPDRAILVTDGISATGMPDGVYTLGNMQVQVANNRATANGVLSGSILTLDKAVENLIAFTHTPLATAVQLATANPAVMLGLEVPALSVGQPANMNLFTANGKLQGTMLHGRLSTKASNYSPL